MIITISGTPGSGKSTIAEKIAEKLHYKRYSVGDLRRKMAEKRGMTIDKYNKLGETDESTDKDADEYQKRLGKNEDDFVIDGRLSFHFIPDSVKIFLDCDLDVAAKRIFKHQRDNEDKKDSVEEVKEALQKRIESDEKRYRNIYGIEYTDKKHFDIIIDTTDLTPFEVVDNIIAFLDQKL